MAHMDTDELARRIDAAIGDELRAQRNKRKLSRAALAKLSGVSEKTIQRVEEGERSPDTQQLAKLTAALRMTMTSFVELALRDIEGVSPPPAAPTSLPG